MTPAIRVLFGPLLLALAFAAPAADKPAPVRPVVIGSKTFTESVILGEMMAGLLRAEGIPAVHRPELGGTRVLWNAMLQGEIDAYPEYTGTLLREVLAGEPDTDEAHLEEALARRGVGIAARPGFNDSFVLGMKADEARRLGIERVSDLKDHPELRLGFSNEFMDREDGWPGLRVAYGLPQTPSGMQHDLAYRGLSGGYLDIIDLFSTDPEIDYYHLRRLTDDQGFFPRYESVLVYRIGLRADAVTALKRLNGVIGEDDMVRLNAEAKLGRKPETQVAAGFLRERLKTGSAAPRDGRWQRIAVRTGEHLRLVGLSLGAAIPIAIPLGILAYLRPRVGETLLAAAGLIQTIPALALLVFMIPLLGIGAMPAIAALFLYSLLPIIHNTVAGLRQVPPDVRDSAIALGLPTGPRLRLVELPLAAHAILAGIKTAAVINIGTATLGALIGAGGYGEPILTGIRRDDMAMILEGAIPAALMALAAQALFQWAERRWMRWGVR